MDQSRQPAKVDKSAPGSAFEQLADLLREEIRSGRLGPGHKLPSERELMDHHDLARGTVRQAVEILRGEGLITVAQGRGAFVQETSPVIDLPLPDGEGPGPPASLLTAIEQSGAVPQLRPLGIPPAQDDPDRLQTAVIVFADGIPLALWQASIHQRATAWPGPPDTGIHQLFPPDDPTVRLTIQTRYATRDETRTLVSGGSQPVMDLRVEYQSEGRRVEHWAVLVADRTRLTKAARPPAGGVAA